MVGWVGLAGSDKVGRIRWIGWVGWVELVGLGWPGWVGWVGSVGLGLVGSVGLDWPGWMGWVGLFAERIAGSERRCVLFIWHSIAAALLFVRSVLEDLHSFPRAPGGRHSNGRKVRDCLPPGGGGKTENPHAWQLQPESKKLRA